MKFKKKTQVSVFLILALLIVVIGMWFFYSNKEAGLEEVSQGVKIAVENVPTEFEAVNNFVKECLEDISAEGMSILGKQGGYINTNPADSIQFAPVSDLRVSYWYHMSSRDDCTNCNFKSARPNIALIESQLGNYVEENLDKCLNEFSELKNQGFEISFGDKKAEAKITENSVFVLLDYGLNVKKGTVSAKISSFYVDLPVQFLRIYNLATSITNFEIKDKFLEKASISLITSFAGVDRKKLPPVSDYSFEFGSSNNWLKDEVKDNVKGIMSSYMPLFQVYNTKNYNRNIFSDDLKQSLYDDFIVPLVNESYPDFEVTFDFLDFWPMYFDLNCNGNFCEPESASSNFLSLVGIQRYNFMYDLSFPVLVTIKEAEALNNKGYNFMFFLEANLRNNEPLYENSILLKAPSSNVGSLMCDFENRNKEIMIKVKDSVTLKPLDRVNVLFSVGDESCFIGSTGNDGTLKGKFPEGTLGGIITFSKPDYIAKFKLFNDKENYLEQSIEPILLKKLILKKKVMEKRENGWTFSNKVINLDSKEQGFLTLRKLEPLTEEEFTDTINIKGSDIERIRIAPGKYNVKSDIFYTGNFKIPAEERKVQTGILISEIIKLHNGISFNESNPYPSASLDLNVTITKKNLEKDSITFYVLSVPLQDIPENLRSVDDLVQVGKYGHYLNLYAPLLSPKFQ